MNGLEHISIAFRSAQTGNRAALMPYYTIGYPNMDTSLDVIEAIARSGADLIELGMPFSDPLADGPTIQRSTQIALEAGVTIAGCLVAVRQLRMRGVSIPLLLMGYINPLLSYGVRRFVSDAAAAGADGLILPDLPPEEAQEVEEACREHGLALVYLLSPASTAERVALVASRASGFIYLVSVLGVTGAREQLSGNLAAFVANVRNSSRLPLAVGFGISSPQQAAEVARIADGVIVGSALITAAGSSGSAAGAVAEFVHALYRAIASSAEQRMHLSAS